MAANNLRVVYRNLADDPNNAITVSSTASSTTTAANLITDYKGQVWRSATASTSVEDTRAIIKLTCTTPSVAGCIVLAYNNLKVGTLIRVRGYLGTAPTITTGTIDVPLVVEGATSTLMFDTDYVDCIKPAALGSFEWGLDTFGLIGNTADFNYTTVWLEGANRTPCTSFIIEVQNRGNVDRNIRVGRLIIGDYWSPTYNTSFGITQGIKDTSSSERSESGDLISSIGSIYKTLSFDLKYMNPKDRNEFNRAIKVIGTRNPIFVSIFPNNTTDYIKEQVHEIYGKFTQTIGINHPIFEMYDTQVEIEEI